MVNRKMEIINELNEAGHCLDKAHNLSEEYKFVQSLLDDITEKLEEVKVIVRGADEVMPKGQTKIQDSLEEPELLGYKLGSLMGE